MFQNFDVSALLRLIAAILDYVFKAVVVFKDTNEGRDEWLDIEAAARQVIGDEQGASNARAQAANIRQNTTSQAVHTGDPADTSAPTSKRYGA